MSKHHLSKAKPVGNGLATTAVANGNHEQDQPPFAEDKVRDVETARLAYSYWEARGNVHGSAEADWVRAEQEIKISR